MTYDEFSHSLGYKTGNNEGYTDGCEDIKNIAIAEMLVMQNKIESFIKETTIIEKGIATKKIIDIIEEHIENIKNEETERVD